MSEELFRSQGYVPCRNTSSRRIPSYAAMRVTNSSIVRKQPWVIVDQPNAYGSQYSVVINGPVPIPPKGDGFCHFANTPVYAAYDGAEPTFGELYGPVDGEWKLQRNVGGFMSLGSGAVLDKPNRVYVIRHPLLTLRGKCSSSVSQGNPGTMTVYQGGTETSYTVTFQNALGDIDANKWVVLGWRDNQWEADNAEC